MTTISNGESGLSVRNKINEIINKVEGVTAINNSIDVTGTVTADGLTLSDGDDRTITGPLNNDLIINSRGNTPGEGTRIQSSGVDRLVVDDTTGDISFYEDTGTTPKFFWDASAERLNVGSVSDTGDNATLDVQSENSGGYTELRISNIGIGADTGCRIVLNSLTGGAYGRSFIDSVSPSSNNTYLAFSTESSNTVAERMRITSTGNVGIGTSSPYATNGTNLEIYDATTIARLSLHTGSGKHWAIGSAASDSRLSFYDIDNSSEAMAIASTGNVGIGTSSPVALLHVNNSGTGSSDHAYAYFTTGDTGSTAADGLTVGYAASNVAVVSNREDTALSLSTGNSNILFNTNGSERARIDASGNLLLAGTGTPTSSVGNLVLYNGTAPTGNATNGVILYAEDVSASSELKVRDEAGNVTTLSPHNFDLIPEGPSEDMAWSYYSERDGKRINVDMLKAIRLLEQISGEKLVHMT